MPAPNEVTWIGVGWKGWRGYMLDRSWPKNSDIAAFQLAVILRIWSMENDPRECQHYIIPSAGVPASGPSTSSPSG